MWTRVELKDKAKGAFKMNYWKTVLVAFLVMVIGGAGGASAGASGGSAASHSSSSESQVVISEQLTDEEIQEMFEETYGGLDEMTDPNVPADELLDVVGITPTEDGFHFEIGPSELLALGAVGLLVLAAIALALAVSALVLNPLQVGFMRFSLRNLNQPAMVSEVGYGFDNNYREVAKTMFLRDIFTILWGLLLIIPGIVKAYEYRMIPYLLADDPTMTSDRAFAESRAMMRGNKWRAFVLDLSFLGWILLSVITLGAVGVFYACPYQMMTNAALYERLRYDAPALQPGGSGPAPVSPVMDVPVAPFATQPAGEAPVEAIEE